MSERSILERLKARWNLQSISQVIIVLIVFACTGFTILFIKKPIQSWIEVSDEHATLFSILYYLLILPIYNIVLLIYGFIFGQFSFFWEFEKKMWRRITGKRTEDENGNR